ncbi:MAG TPA: MlaD family protein [Solirubrobacteraceae bacterium]|nr:MlaD family protein [Solirubrobacteraceae bacterium]
MRRAIISAGLILAAVAFVVITSGASKGSAQGTYKIEFQNAFGLVTGADFKVAGVPAGTIKAINLDQKSLNAVVTIQVNRSGFGQFHQDATCESRPESLIGEYFVDCNPGSSGPVLKAGSTIPVSHTQSTIPADLLQDTMRLPYRQRFTLIVNELGAAAAGRSGDIEAALHRAVPALDETDSLLKLLASDSGTLQSLTKDSNSVITALANNSKNVNKFIDVAGKTAADTATQQGNLRVSLQRLPGLLQQLKPTLAQLGTTVTTNEPVLQNLNEASGQIDRLLTDLPAFSKSARPAIKSLGQASVTGKAAVTSATPTVKDLNAFAKPTPELAGNLAIVLKDLDDPSRAVEKDPRSPGGKGFTGLEALLGYVFNQTLAINTFGPEGHILAVDAFASPMCSAYATPATIALAIKQYGAAYRQCYSWLGPNQPGVNETDPSDPSAPVPDPGGAPPGERGPSTDASRLTAAEVDDAINANKKQSASQKSKTTKSKKKGKGKTAANANGSANSTASSNGSSSSSSSGSGAPPIDLGKTLGQVLQGTVGGTPTPQPAQPAATTSTPAPSSSGGGSSSSPGNSAQQLLNYLLSP